MEEILPLYVQQNPHLIERLKINVRYYFCEILANSVLLIFR